MFNRLIIISLIGFAACSEPNSLNKVEPRALDAEAREDSLELAAAYAAQSNIEYVVTPNVETQSVRAQAEDDAADDPAIWIHPEDPSQSVVFGTNKKGGVIAFDLEGEELYYLRRGKINNVDVVQNVSLEGQTFDLITFSNRTKQCVELIPIVSGSLDTLNGITMSTSDIGMDDVYGVCFGMDSQGTLSVYANAKNGVFHQYEVAYFESSLVMTLVRELRFEDQPEGMVADNKRNTLYVGLENSGILKLGQAKSDTSYTRIAGTSESENNKLRFDLEGLALMKNGSKDYLVVSSQGNFSYAVFDINNNDRYLGSFKVETKGIIDGVEETDGIEIYSDSLNVRFPNGVFIAQDGFNYEGDSLISQNFKYVELGSILQLEFFK